MRTTVKTTDMELVPEVSEYLDKKVAALDKFVDPNDTTAICRAEIGRVTKHHQSGNVYYAEFNVETKGRFFRATAQEETLFAAIDKVKDDVQRELRRSKRKEQHLLRRGGGRLKELTRSLSERGARLRGFVERYQRKRRK